jgi:hypothetical protein
MTALHVPEQCILFVKSGRQTAGQNINKIKTNEDLPLACTIELTCRGNVNGVSKQTAGAETGKAS